MPIGFIVSGVILILILFNRLGLNSQFEKLFAILAISVFMYSYFFDYLYVGDIYFNILQIISFILFLIYLIHSRKFLCIRFLFIGIVILLIDIKLQINCFTFAIFDMSILFDSFIVFYVLNLIFDKFYNFYCRRCYVEKICFNHFNCSYSY